MSWLGKIIGGAFGYTVAGPVGLVLGVFFGHSVDKTISDSSQLRGDWQSFSQNDLTHYYVKALFSIMGHLAKLDGRVSEVEIQYARNVMANMGLSAAGTRKAIEYFNAGKATSFNVGQVLARLQEKMSPDHVLVQTLLENLLGITYIDGPMTVQQRTILLQVCNGLGISRLDFERLDALFRAQNEFYRAYQGREESTRQRSYQRTYTPPQSDAPTLAEAYEILEVKSTSTEAEIKKGYRRLMSRHHPDKLIAQGVSAEMIKLATSKAQRVKAAYDVIKKSRGIK